MCYTQPKKSSMHAHLSLPSLIQRLAWAPLRLLVGRGQSCEVVGIEHIRALTSPVIFASNHISEFDPLLLVASLPFTSRHLPLHYVARESSFYAPGWKRFVYGGIAFRLMGAHPAYVGKNNYYEALPHHLRVLAQGRSVGIFPMGGIQKSESLRPKGGALFLSHTTGHPIVPVKIEGLERVTIGELYTGRRRIRVVFGEPVHAQDLLETREPVFDPGRRNDFDAGAISLMERIMQL